MARINLRDFYPWYTHDEFVEVPDVIAAELFTERHYKKIEKQRMRRNNSSCSLDAGNGLETAAVIHVTDNPEVVFEMMARHCRICCALNSLSEIQGRRIEAHYILGKSQAEIAKAEGVTKGAVSISITRGLEAMKKYLKVFRPGC